MPPIPPHTQSLAIVMPSWIGDTVMTTPVLRAMREHLPQARITGVVRQGLDEILCGTSWLDEILVWEGKVAGQLRRQLRRIKPDAVLLLPNSFRSALGARFCGAAVRIGYDRDCRGWLLTHRKPLRVPKHVPVSAVDYYAELAEWALGVERIDRKLQLCVTEDERNAAGLILQNVREPFALLNPGANRADKRWPAENFAKLADWLAGARGMSVVLSGSPKERTVLDSISNAATSSIIDLSSRGMTLGTLKAVIQRAAIVITNDTGPRHMAAALGTPVVTLFGPTDRRWTTLERVQERMLLAEPFLPEELVADKHAKACAMEKISVGDVVAAVESLLNRAGMEAVRQGGREADRQ